MNFGIISNSLDFPVLHKITALRPHPLSLHPWPLILILCSLPPSTVPFKKFKVRVLVIVIIIVIVIGVLAIVVIPSKKKGYP